MNPTPYSPPGCRRRAPSFVERVGILTAANFAGAAIGLAQGVFVARRLGPELYGVAALVLAYPSLVYTFFSARSADVSVKYVGEFHARGETRRILSLCKWTYTIDLAIAALAAAVVLATTRWASQQIVHRPEARTLLTVAAMSFLPGAVVNTSYAILAVLCRFSWIAWIDTAASVMRAGLVIGLVSWGWGVAGVVWGNALAAAGAGLLYASAAWLQCRRVWSASPWSGDYGAISERRTEILSFLAYNDLTALVGMIPKQLDVVVLGCAQGPTQAGYYRLAKSLASAVNYLVGPLQSVTYPELVELQGAGNRAALQRRAGRMARIGAPLGLAVALGALAVPRVLPLVAGRAYEPAVPATELLLLAGAVWIACFWLRPLYLARGWTRDWFALSSLAAVLSVLVYLFVVPRWGIVALSAWSLVLAILTHGIGLALLLRKGRSAPKRLSEHIAFLSGTTYRRPLDPTTEKKFARLAELGELFVIGFSETLRPRRFFRHARFILLPRWPFAALRYAQWAGIGTILVLWLAIRHRVRIFVAQSPYEGLAAAAVKRCLGWFGVEIVLVVENHGDFEESLFLQRRVWLPGLQRMLMRAAASWALSHADLLRSISGSTRAQLERWAPGKPVLQFPTWTDLSVFLESGSRRNGSAGAQTILYAGVLIPRKGVLALVNAFGSLASEFPEAALLLCGSAVNRAYAAQLEARVGELGLGERVRFVDKVPQSQLAGLMADASVFVLPSVSEGLGRVVLEAMAAGALVVASRIGGVPDMVEDGRTGFLIPPGDEAALAQRLRWTLEHPRERREMGERASLFARRFFSSEQYLDGYRNIVHAATALKHAPAGLQSGDRF